MLWALTSFLANPLISLFAFAFSLDLVNGSQATGGAGALAPVSRAIHSIYANVFGAPWLVLAVAVAGIWAMWKALVQRRYSETAGALGLSLIYVVLALFFVAQPGTTIGSRLEVDEPDVGGVPVDLRPRQRLGRRRQAKDDDGQQLFDLLVFKPWAVLEFGGLEHCVLAGSGSEDSDPESVAVRPLSSNPARDAALARRLAGRDRGHRGRQGLRQQRRTSTRSHFLRFGLGTDERERRVRRAERRRLLQAPRRRHRTRGYRLGVADKPATDAMEEGGQYQRLLLAIVVFVGELGAFCCSARSRSG